MIRHLNDMTALHGEAAGVREMRKHLCWYTKGLYGGAEFRTRINHLAGIKDVRREIGEYFASMQRCVTASP
jgi:tRNA-dihydrouridine synthase B